MPVIKNWREKVHLKAKKTKKPPYFNHIPTIEEIERFKKMKSEESLKERIIDGVLAGKESIDLEPKPKVVRVIRNKQAPEDEDIEAQKIIDWLEKN